MQVQPEHELALLLAGTAASRIDRDCRLQQLARNVDFAQLEAFLRKQRMLVLLGRRLQEVSTGLPGRFCDHVREDGLSAQRHGVYQQMITVRVAAALEEAGIRVLPLKGPLLGERLYGDVGARISADIDLLVEASDLQRAVEIIRQLGYREQRPSSGSHSGQPVLHERLVHPSALPVIELHWRVHWYEGRFSAELLAHSSVGADGCLRPRAEDELAELLLLYARDGFAGLRLLADLAAWWDLHATELSSDGIERVAFEHPAVARALATAVLLAEQMAELPAHDLLPASARARASRLAMRLANWSLEGKKSQIDANVSLIDLLLAPRERRRALMHRHLQLARENFLAHRPNANLSRQRALWVTSVHAMRTVSRYVIALWAVLRRGAWAPLPSRNA